MFLGQNYNELYFQISFDENGDEHLYIPNEIIKDDDYRYDSIPSKRITVKDLISMKSSDKKQLNYMFINRLLIIINKYFNLGEEMKRVLFCLVLLLSFILLTNCKEKKNMII